MRSRSTVLKSAPLKIYLEPTDRCNLSCEYCYPRSQRELKDLDMRLFDDVERQLFPTCAEVNLFLSGEPTLHRRFDTMLERCALYPFTTKLFSNLSYRNNRLLDVMVACGVFLNVSLDGTGESMRFRKGGREELILENIRYLLKKAETTGQERFHLRIATVVSKANVKGLADWVRFVRGLGVSEIMLGCLDGAAKSLSHLCLSAEDAPYFEEAVAAANEQGLRISTPTHIGGVRLSQASNWSSIPLAVDKTFRHYCETANPDVESSFCPYPWIQTVIHMNGLVSSCCQRKHCLGNWRDGTDFIRDIWNNEAYRRLRSHSDYNACTSPAHPEPCNMMTYSIWGGFNTRL